MSLWDRLAQQDDQIGGHPFPAMLGEIERGARSKADLVSFFSLSPQEATDLDATLARLIAPQEESYALGGFASLANVGTTFKVIAVLRLQTAGIVGFEFGCFVSKVGTGVQSWQLWDQTNSQQVAVFDDAGAAGDHVLGPITQAVTSMPVGVRTLALRVRSTVANDDPIHYGSSLRIRRTGGLTPEAIARILILRDSLVPGYTTPAELQTLLG